MTAHDTVAARGTDVSTLNRLLFTAYFLEVGVILLLVPWTHWWAHNYFAESFPVLKTQTGNNIVRGAVSGIGVLNLVAGLADLRSLAPWARR